MKRRTIIIIIMLAVIAIVVASEVLTLPEPAATPGWYAVNNADSSAKAILADYVAETRT